MVLELVLPSEDERVGMLFVSVCEERGSRFDQAMATTSSNFS